MASNPVIPPVAVPGVKPAGQAAQVVKIETLPDALKTVSRGMVLEGEVVRQNEDGSTRIRTAQGMIDVVLRGKQPQPGTRLELEVPAGSPPRQITVRPMPAQAQPSQPPQQPSAPPRGETQLPAPAQGQPPTQPAPAAPSQPPQTGQAPTQSPATQVPNLNAGPGTQAPPTQTPSALPPQASASAALAPASPAGPVLKDGGAQQIPGSITAPAASSPARALSGASPPLSPAQAASMLSQTYQPPAKPALAQASSMQLTPGQTVRISPFPPAQATAIVLNAGAPAVPTEGTQLSFSSFQTGLVVGATQGTLQKSLTAGLRALSPNGKADAILSSSPLQVSTPAAAGKAGAAVTMPGIQESVDFGPSFLTAAPSSAGQNGMTGQVPTQPRVFQMDAEILSVKPPAATLSGLAENAAGATVKTAMPVAPQGAEARPFTLMAVVTGFTPQNLPLVAVRWPDGGVSQNMVLQFPATNLSPGSQIEIAPQIPSGTAQHGARPLSPLLSASTLWPVMDDLFQALAQASPPLAQALARVLPSPSSPQQLGAAVMLFAAAARTGDLTTLLGDKKIEALAKAGKSALLSRLSQDIGNAAKSLADAPAGDWKSYPIPMLWQNEIPKIMLHIHGGGRDSEAEKGDGGTRFIMDVSLTRMGDVQLDGLVRGSRLDVIVRTQLPISLSMQDAMRKAYADAMESTNIVGEIGFQSDVKNWVAVTKREDMMIASA